MKNKNLILLLIIAAVSIGKLKAQDSLAKHSVYIAPFAGINSTMKAPIFGGEIGYEFRLSKNFGLTAGANVGYTQKNNPLIYEMGNGGAQALNSKLFQYSFHGGAKYYIGRLYLSADFGYQETTNTINFKYQWSGSSYNTGKYGKVGFYQAYGIGYQIPLTKGDNIEVFTRFSNANSYNNFVAGFRYNFRLSK